MHYPDQGDGDNAADPAYSKSHELQNADTLLPRFRADLTRLVLTLRSSMGSIERYLLHCHTFPIRRNSVLSGFSSSLFVNIHDWTEAKHDSKPFSAAAESPDAKETYRWLSSA